MTNNALGYFEEPDFFRSITDLPGHKWTPRPEVVSQELGPWKHQRFSEPEQLFNLNNNLIQHPNP